MIKKILNKFNNLDNKIKKIMNNGFKFSFAFLILSILILCTYNFYLHPILYISGTILFKTSLMFFVDFIIMGIAFDKLKQQMV